MSLAQNIKKYREHNQLSQEQLAKQMNIARQSISKWENEENLPSIDNLITLSGLLNVSLDELILGEPYLQFPFHYGKPKRKTPILFLGAVLVFDIFLTLQISQGNLAFLLGFLVLSLSMILFFFTYLYPFDYKRYYTYWTLNKTGIEFATPYLRTPSLWGTLDEILLPLKVIFHLRKNHFVSYSNIASIEIKFIPYKTNPSLAWGLSAYSPRIQQTIREDFYFKIRTTENQNIYLDLRHYYFSGSKERELLPTILRFLRRKKIYFIDSDQLFKTIISRESIFDKYYGKLNDD